MRPDALVGLGRLAPRLIVKHHFPAAALRFFCAPVASGSGFCYAPWRSMPAPSGAVCAAHRRGEVRAPTLAGGPKPYTHFCDKSAANSEPALGRRRCTPVAHPLAKLPLQCQAERRRPVCVLRRRARPLARTAPPKSAAETAETHKGEKPYLEPGLARAAQLGAGTRTCKRSTARYPTVPAPPPVVAPRS
jgi:hypothetical protein